MTMNMSFRFVSRVLRRLSLGVAALWLAVAHAQAATDSFSTLFPGFIQACAYLHDLLVPFALVGCVLSFAYRFGTPPLEFMDILGQLTRVFLIVLLINRSGPLINDAQALLREFLELHIPARPEEIAERYRQKLAEAQQAAEPEDQGFFDRISGAGLFASFVAGVLTLIAWAGMAVVWFVFLVQKVALLLCWALSPLLFGLFALPPVAGIAMRHLLRIVGILLWPIGLALAATITDGLLDGMVKDSFLKDVGVIGAIGYGFNNLLALALLALWIIGSSILFPLVMSRIIGAGTGAASTLTRSGELSFNLGAPTAWGLTLAGWSYARTQWSRWRSGRTEDSASGAPTPPPPEPVPAMPTDTPEPPPTDLAREFVPEFAADDPAGDHEVRETLTGMNKPTPES